MSETLQHYDRWSVTYDAGDNPMVGATAWALDRNPLAVAGRDVVEIGCGTGRHIARVLGEGARSYTGIDGSPGMLAVARARHPDPRVELVEVDLHRGISLGARFDIALIALVLEHVDELAPLFRDVAQLLRPGGRLRIVEIHPTLVAAGTVAHFRDAAGEVQFPSVAHAVPALTAALRAAGFTSVIVRELVAEGELVAAVPKLAKHRGRPVVLDVDAQ